MRTHGKCSQSSMGAFLPHTSGAWGLNLSLRVLPVLPGSPGSSNGPKTCVVG